jgi:hypothetical protein
MPRYFFNVYKDLPEKRAHGRMLLIVASLAFSSLAQADDNRGLRRGGDPHQVSISGLSSGGAMALQYAVAHSGSIIGVGSVAGPAWYCAEGDLAHAMQVCMKGQGTVRPKTDLARQFAAAGKIDSLSGNTTSALKHSFVFQSKDDEVLNPRSGQANVDFLAALTGVAPKVDQGRSDDGSANAGHGIISPDGTDSCSGKGKTFIRRCGAEDNPAEVLSTMYGEEMPDPSTRKEVGLPRSGYRRGPLSDERRPSDPGDRAHYRRSDEASTVILEERCCKKRVQSASLTAARQLP